MKHFLLTTFFFLVCNFASAQDVWLHPNKGQWDDEILYNVELTNGSLLVDKNGFTYSLNNVSSHRHQEHSNEHSEPEKIKCHVVKSHFVNANWSGLKSENNPSRFYRNYYLGNDASKWKSSVYSYSQVTLNDFYSGVDLLLDGSAGKLKYSFIVQPGVDASQIKYVVDGADKIILSKEGLRINTSLGEILEENPIAWTEKEGKRSFIPVNFHLEGNIVSFQFPDGYASDEILVIDPSLVFSSFTGATADNWGMTATPDLLGNLYAGGIVFSGGGTYPTITGSFDLSFNGGYNYTYTQGSVTYSMNGFDAAISKFNANGTSLIFSTYLGGNGNEAPHSLVTDENNNLYVMGVTGSVDFPTVNGCFDISFNGGPVVAENELGYNGADLFVTRFNAAGSALVGSTFVGGTGTDGINIGALNYNYGDSFRGEITVEDGFVYVSSTTQSVNFPTVGAGQGFLNGIQDAVIFKMNSALTNMAWSTYFGGTGLESGNSVQLASNGNVFVAGGTNSIQLPVNSGNDLTYNGGTSDGYLLKIAGSSSLFQAGTFLGLNEYDQAYFVQLDQNDEVYVYGQTESSWAISPGVYGNPNSGQFIRKYNNNLGNILWTTMIGAGTGHPEISPTAFLVSECFDIYISGWGGTINSSFSTQAFYSTSNGFPVTFDAYQLTTNGSNFYLAVLDENAATLKYGTYMGGTTSSYNHVDGGTSRFDKSGRIYHAVCGACGGQDFGFTSTPGVWSPTNNSSNCNLAAFKFELNEIQAIISNPQTIVCLPNPIIFSNNSANGNSFFWDFGDNTTSTDVNPTHVYAQPGTYTVTLIVSDSNACYTPDSTQLDVYIGDFQGGVVQPSSGICPGESIQIEAFGGANYEWSPAAVLDDPTIANPTATIDTTTTFTVIVSDSCGTDTLQLTVEVFIIDTQISNDTSVCIGGSVPIFAGGGASYAWTPVNFLSNPSIANPVATPTVSTEFFVEITTSDGCTVNDSVNVGVFFNPPVPILADTVPMCFGEQVTVTASGGDSYIWSPNFNINTLNGPTVILSPFDDFEYFCDFINACGLATDSIFVDVIHPEIIAGNDTTICPGQSAILWASGGVSYNWEPTAAVQPPYGNLVTVTPNVNTIYQVIGQDVNGCFDTAQVTVTLYPQPFIQTIPDVYAIYGDVITLGASSSTPGQYIWSPAEYLSCTICANPTTVPNQDMIFTVNYTDLNGCSASDNISIYYDPIIYIPNTFTPDDDEFNQQFQIVGSNITEFELEIYNRWGELIYTITDFDDYWDGTYKGKMCQDGTYTWKLVFKDFQNRKYVRTGHVNLLK
jgi:gliding motility-associated-like protein